MKQTVILERPHDKDWMAAFGQKPARAQGPEALCPPGLGKSSPANKHVGLDPGPSPVEPPGETRVPEDADGSLGGTVRPRAGGPMAGFL